MDRRSSSRFCIALAAVGLLRLLATPSILAQGPGSLFVRAGAGFPFGESVRVHTDLRTSAGVSVIASARKWSPEVGCIETSPSPCSPEGLSLGAGVRLIAESEGSWWPFLDLTAGGHRYSSGGEWFLFAATDFGIGWYVGDRGSMELGGTLQMIDAGPPDLPLGAFVSTSSSHQLAALSFMVGLRVN